jgi:hypothetical protein
MSEMTNASECHRDAVFVCRGDPFVVLADAPRRAHRRSCAEVFFDTLLFCGAILLLANSIDKMKNKVGTLLIANRKITG